MLCPPAVESATPGDAGLFVKLSGYDASQSGAVVASGGRALARPPAALMRLRLAAKIKQEKLVISDQEFRQAQVACRVHVAWSCR